MQRKNFESSHVGGKGKFRGNKMFFSPLCYVFLMGNSLYKNFVFKFKLVCVARVSVGLVLPARKMVQEPKRGKRGRGRGRKETLADKPLDFENRLLDLSCLSVHTKISCCHGSRTCQDMSEATSSRNGEISMNPSDQCSF